MIINARKTNYLSIELTRTELISILLGGTAVSQGTQSDFPCLANVYCSNPATSEALLEELEQEWREERIG